MNKNFTAAKIMAAIRNAQCDGTTEVYRCLVTPELAKMLLGANYINNRTKRPSVVKKYITDMKEGFWVPESNDMIVINKDGHMENGQHRCLGIVDSGIPQVLYIQTMASEKAFEVMDNGCTRRTSDYLYCSEPKKVAEVGKRYYGIVHGNGNFYQITYGRKGRNTSATRSEELYFIRDHQEEISDYVENGKAMAKRLDKKFAAHCAIALMMISVCGNPDKLDRFVSDFQNLCNMSPAITVCQNMIKGFRKGEETKSAQRDFNIGLILTAYELYRSGDSEMTETFVRKELKSYTKTISMYDKLFAACRNNTEEKATVVTAA